MTQKSPWRKVRRSRTLVIPAHEYPINLHVDYVAVFSGEFFYNARFAEGMKYGIRMRLQGDYITAKQH